MMGLDGSFHDPDLRPETFLRIEIVIQSMAGDGLGAFSLRGDSGAVVVNDDNKVVGLLGAEVGTDEVMRAR